MKKSLYKEIQIILCLSFFGIILISPVNIITAKTPLTNYQLLAPLPGAGGTPLKEVNPREGLGNYLNLMIKIFIGLCAVLSVVMIVIGGIEYMTSELISSKEAGKERIRNALLGLLIALGAYALLFTINPDLLKSDLCIFPQVIKDGKCVNPSPTTPTPTPINTQFNVNYSGSNTNRPLLGPAP
ncbi:hypothetical protein EXS45_01010 [Candidatus Nomurabacteria bacterium]|nr:hypothetical protein [Candidatus Nomurabacteria bacterium]